MKRSLVCAVVLAVSSAILLTGASIQAQDAAGDPPVPHNGLEDSVQGVFVTPVAGAPFSGTVEIKEEILYADGRISTAYAINEIARDSSGRIHNEMRRGMPEDFRGTSELVEVHIFDPQTGVNIYYDPQTRVASRRVLPRPPVDLNARLIDVHQPQSKDLGTALLNGIQCRGTLKTYAIPTPGKGAGSTGTVSDESWYSEDLQINILTKHSLPFGGGKTAAVLKVKRQQPDPALFEVPEGYKIVDVTPPPSTLVRQPRAQAH